MARVGGSYADYVDDAANGIITPKDSDPNYAQWSQDSGNAPQSSGEQNLATSYDSQAPVTTTGTTTPTNSQAETSTPSNTTPAPQSADLRASIPQDSTRDFWGNLFGNTEDRLSTAGTALKEGQKSFYDLAGPSQSFEGLGGQSVLKNAAEKGGANDMASAGAMLGAQYQGPTGMDTNNTDIIERELPELQAQQKVIGSSVGMADRMAQVHPNLTRGERAMEQASLMANPEFTQKSNEEKAKIDQLVKDYEAARSSTGAYATQRAGEESGIQQQAKDYLGTLQGEWRAPIEQQVAAETANKAQAQALYQQFQEDPIANEGLLAQIDPKYLGFDPSVFNSQRDQSAVQGQQAQDAIMSQFEDLQDIPMLDLAVSSKGHEEFKFPVKWFEDNKDKYTQKQRKALLARATERQRALEEAVRRGKVGAGNSTTVAGPGDEPGPEATKKDLQAYKQDLRTNKAGAYSELMPMYYGDAVADPNTGETNWQQVSAAPSVEGWEGGDTILPNVDNMSTKEQSTVINRIDTMLGKFESMNQDADPYKAQKIMADVEDFIKREDDQAQRRKDSLTEAQLAWKAEVDRVHARYKKLQGQHLDRFSAWNPGNASNLVSRVGKGGFAGVTGQDYEAKKQMGGRNPDMQSQTRVATSIKKKK
jgi:hypothetical protein